MEWIKWIGDNLIVISVIIGVGTVFYYIVRWFVLTNYIVKKDIPKLEENYKNDIKSIKEDIKEIRNWIVNALFKTENQTVAKSLSFTDAKSPINLNKKGREVNEKIKANFILEKYKNEFFNKLDFPYENNYKIQEECSFIINKNLKDILKKEEWNKLEENAYDEGISVVNFYTIFQILLRDMAIKENDKIKTKK